MASREYSKRLGAISDEQLQAALDRFGLGRMVSAEPIANGLFGQNLMVSTTSGEYVFRGAPHWNPAGEDDWQFEKERFFSRLMHESKSGPPVAWPYLLDEGRTSSAGGFPFSRGSRVARSVSRFPAHHTEAEMREQSGRLGEALARCTPSPCRPRGLMTSLRLGHAARNQLRGLRRHDH